MEIKNVSNFYKSFNEKGVIISYQGPFLQEMIEEIGLIINKKLTNNSKLPMNGRYLSLFIELSQNILRYSADTQVNEDGKQISNGLILMGIKDKAFYIISGNPIKEEHEDILREKLSLLNNCSKNELNTMFKEQLRGINTNHLSKGAGLGLIDIARKADKLEHSFSTLDTGERFFTIKIEFDI